MIVESRQPEVLGLFGFTWWEAVLGYMKKLLRGFPERKLVTQLWKNKTLILNLHREYFALLAKGYKAVNITGKAGKFYVWNPESYKMSGIIAKKLNVTRRLVTAFFNALYTLAAAGKIPFAKWNPAEYEKAKKLKEKFPTEKPFYKKFTETVEETTKKATGILMPVAIVGGIAAAYLLLKAKKTVQV